MESDVSRLGRDLQKIFDESYTKAFRLNKPIIAITNLTIKPEPTLVR